MIPPLDGSTQARRGLAILAHPDDVDFNAAGTVAKWVKAGIEVTYLLVTSGDAGGFGSVSREKIASTRRREQIEAGRIVGVTDVRFLEGYPDGKVQVTEGLVKDIVRVIREVRPHLVLSMSAERDWFRVHQGHPDDLAVGEATARAVYPASRNPFAFPELVENENLQAWTVEELWIQAHPRPNHAEDIANEMDLKLEAVLAHVSQHPNPAAVAEALQSRMHDNADAMGLPKERFVETFLKVSSL